MHEESKGPSLSLIVNPAVKQTSRQHATDSDRPRPIEQQKLCCKHVDAAYLRGLGRGFNGRNNTDVASRGAQARTDTFFDTAKIQAQAACMSMILDQCSNEIYIFAAASLKFIYVNEAARRNVQYSLDELKRRVIADISPDYSFRNYARSLAPLQSGEKTLIELETMLRREDGFR